MFRKSIYISVIVCLLVLSNYALAFDWNPNNTWQGTVDTNWFNPDNWYVTNSEPNIYIHALVPSNADGPIINGDACCMYLNIEPWSQGRSYTEWGAVMNSGTLDVNYGIGIGNGNFTIADGGIPTFTVNGGTVRQLLRPGDGVSVGGGYGGYDPTFGKLYMYGGSLTTPRLELRNGEILLYGGTLVCDGNDEPNFVFYQTWPTNRIDMSGGTLILKDDRVSELDSLISARRIISLRGELIGPTYNAGDGNTILTSEPNLGSSWDPSPANYAVDVRYHPTVGLTLHWKPGDWVGNTTIDDGHYVFIGTVRDNVDTVGLGTAGTASPLYQGHVVNPPDPNDPNLFIPEANVPFKPNYTYYWRVDEVNSVSGISYKGLVWQFKMKTDAASDPQPASGGGLKMPLQLNWTAGDWSTGLHKVYIATDYGQCNAASEGTTDGRYRGTVSDPVYPLSKLLDTGTGMAAFGPLDPEKTYYWRIDEVSSTGGNKKGTVWDFDTGTYVTIDDFQEYTFTDDLNDAWVAAPVIDCGGTPLSGSGKISLIREGQSDRYMQFTYNKSGSGGGYFSEVELPYSSSGVNWTSGGVLSSPPKLLELAYRGFATNSSDGHSGYIYDRMYVAVEDTNNHVSITLQPDPNAQRTGSWTTWAISYDELASDGTPGARVVDMNYVTDLYLGAGVRCLDDYAYGSDGNIMFDNIRILSATCVPSEGPVADFDNDCFVGPSDLGILANDWLVRDEDYDFTATQQAPHRAPILWYDFNETSGTTCADSGTADANDYTGTVINPSPANWNSNGHIGKCIYLPPGQNSYISVIANGNPLWDVENTDGYSFSMWIWADINSPEVFNAWCGLFEIFRPDGSAVDVMCPTPWPPAFEWGPACSFAKNNLAGDTDDCGTGYGGTLDDYGGRWNNWIFVHNRTSTPAEMCVYLNGNLVGDTNSIDDADVAGPLVIPPVTDFVLGSRNPWWGWWAGWIDDFKIFDYPLTENEAQYIASDGTGLVHLEVASRANIKKSPGPPPGSGFDIVNFGDLAMMCDEWMTEKLWP